MLALFWGVCLFVAAGVFVAPVLRARRPTLWWWTIGYPMTVVRVLVSWRAVAVECDLTTTRLSHVALLDGLIVRGRELRPLIPRIRPGRPTRWGLVVTVRLLAGQVPDSFEKACEAMAHAWRVHAVRVTSPKRGYLTLTVLGIDPLAGTITVPVDRPGRTPLLIRVATAARVLAQGLEMDIDTDHAIPSTAELLAVRVGMRDDGRPWVMDLGMVPHWLVTGATQSGKSTLINALMVGLAPRPVALVGIDCKGGLALAPYRKRLSALATTRGQAVGLLEALTGEMTDRMTACADAGVRTVWDLPAPVRPVPVVVIVDEIAELYLTAHRAEKDDATRAATALVRLGQLGAALGVHLVVAGQRVGSELGQGVTLLRAQLGGRICHRVADPETAVMTLGDLNPDALEAAQTITFALPGVAIVADDTGAWTRTRSAPVTVAQAEQVAAAWAHLTPALPVLDTTNEGR